MYAGFQSQHLQENDHLGDLRVRCRRRFKPTKIWREGKNYVDPPHIMVLSGFPRLTVAKCTEVS